MPNLKQLIVDVEKFPERKREINLQCDFREYWGKISELYLKLKATIEDAVRIEESIGKESSNKNRVLTDIKAVIREASKLKQSIEEDAGAIASKATENALMRMNEKATSSSTKCRECWKQHIDRNVTKWTQITTVLERFPSTDCLDFKNAVRELSSARDRIPKSPEQVQDAKKLQEDLQKGISKLGLEGVFGEFLKNASMGNCSLSQVFEPEVKAKLDEFHLWDIFKISL
jgi:hypothetical protein